MKVAIVDDHHIIVSSIEGILHRYPDIEIVGKFNSGEAFKRALAFLKIEVLILDYHLPDLMGTQVARYVSYHFPEIKILMLTGYNKPGLSEEIFESGCTGFLLKTTADVETIVDAIRRVYKGQLYLDNTLKKQTNGERTADTTRKVQLTRREIEILKYIVEEYSSNEIAEKLFISKKTVDNHRSSLMIKSGAKNTVGLIKFAMDIELF